MHAELENIKSAGEKNEKKYTILASNGPRMLGNMFHQSRPKHSNSVKSTWLKAAPRCEKYTKTM
jgi:hypothetical protein